MRITLARDGTLTFLNGAVDIGQGSSTVLLQIAAAALGLPLARLSHAGWRHRPDGGCRQVLRLAADLRLGQRDPARGRGLCARKILALANAGAGRQAERWRAARLQIWDGEASRSASISPACRRLHPAAGAVDHRATTWCSTASAAGTRRPAALDANGQGVPYATYGFAAQMAEVEVDIGAGHHQSSEHRGRARRRPQPSTRRWWRARSTAASRRASAWR